MKQLTLHDGSIVHIVRTPEEVEQLKRSNSDGSFNWHFHGSDEHLESLRKLHVHHTNRAAQLREQNPEIHAAMDNIRNDLDDVARELEKLTNKPVELKANFDRFGYSAKVRAHAAPDPEKGGMDAEDDSAIAVGMRPLRTDSDTSERKKSTTLKIYKKPVLRQYFHKGLLYRAREVEEVASFELFLDLLYVGIIAINGDKATEHPTGNGFLRFAVTIIPSWKVWSDVGMLVSQFDTDDLIQRTIILFIVACLVGYTTNIVAAFETTYSQLIGFYLAARICVTLTMAFMAYILPHVRPIMTLNVLLNLMPIALWIGSIFVVEPRREALIWVAIFLDLCGNVLVSMFLLLGARYVSSNLHQRISNLFAYFPAVNIEHKTQRMGAFVSLVFGYSVVALLYQNQAKFGMNVFFGKAILGLIQAYCFNWIYFDIDGSFHHVHAIRRHAISSSVWLTAHLPFIMAFTISGAALSRLVVAHDSPSADPETLTLTYEEKSEAELPDGLRWFYCAGLGVAFICMTLISASHIHTPLETQRLRKRTRLIFRLVIAIVWILLPLAKELSSLSLISITTSLTILTLGVEIYGVSCKHESFWDGGMECKYDCKSLSRSQSIAPSVGDSTLAEKEGGLVDYLCKQQ